MTGCPHLSFYVNHVQVKRVGPINAPAGFCRSLTIPVTCPLGEMKKPPLISALGRNNR